MRLISIRNPWAFAVASGRKPIETREWKAWSSHLRQARELVGEVLALHAGKTLERRAVRTLQDLGAELDPALLVPGIIGVGKLVAVRALRRTREDILGAVWQPLPAWANAHLLRSYDPDGLTALVFAEPILLQEPIPLDGMLGFPFVPEPVERAVREQLAWVSAGKGAGCSG